MTRVAWCVLRGVSVLALLASTPACSFLSGWGDLEGGGAPADVDASTASGGGRGAGGAGGADGGGAGGNDAGLAGDADAGIAPITDRVICDGTRCDPGEVCCVSLTQRSATCSAAGSCPIASASLGCTSTKDCSEQLHTHAYCCLHLAAVSVAACAVTCDPPAATLCDPDEHNACPDGTDCRSDPALATVSSCR